MLAGGPGGGKSTAADLFHRELGDQLVIVPEAATLLFRGGYPRYSERDAIKAMQRAIYQVQIGLEDTQRSRYPGRALLCDRGTVDGAAYWPDGPEDFFAAIDSTLAAELSRYDAVVFFESAAVGGIELRGLPNPARVESAAAAAVLDASLRKLWSNHPRFVHVPHNPSFIAKISSGLLSLQRLLADTSAL